MAIKKGNMNKEAKQDWGKGNQDMEHRDFNPFFFFWIFLFLYFTLGWPPRFG
jgi:hypothetical protein